MSDDPFDFNADDLDPEMKLEREVLRSQVTTLIDKMNGDNTDPININDLFQYMRIINFNFVMVHRITEEFYQKLDLVYKELAGINTKLDTFIATDDLIEESLDESDTQSN